METFCTWHGQSPKPSSFVVRSEHHLSSFLIARAGAGWLKKRRVTSPERDRDLHTFPRMLLFYVVIIYFLSPEHSQYFVAQPSHILSSAAATHSEAEAALKAD